VQTLPHTTQEQRAHLYEDVEQLILPGFLSQNITIGGRRMALRSLSPGDVFLLQARVGLESSQVDWRAWSVATSIWMIDGHNMLGQDWAVPRLAQFVQRLPAAAANILFKVTLGLFERVQLAMKAAEAFLYESTCRFLWRTLGEQPYKRSGIAGVERLGLNHIQRMWLAFNTAEDQRLKSETMWEGFKLSAMAMAPKGVKKLDEAEQRRKEEEAGRRQAVMDRLYYWRAGVIPDEAFEMGKVIGGSLVNGAKSVDDLEDEMRQWVSGERDDHDLIVAQYKQKISDRMKDEEAARMQRLRDLEAKREELEEEQATLPTQLVAYTPDQLQRVLAERGHGGSGARFIGPERNDQRFLYDRYLKAEETTSGLQVVNGRIVHPNADPETDARTLDQLIKGRKVQMGEGD
jgi:hypothetical protein